MDLIEFIYAIGVAALVIGCAAVLRADRSLMRLALRARRLRWGKVVRVAAVALLLGAAAYTIRRVALWIMSDEPAATHETKHEIEYRTDRVLLVTGHCGKGDNDLEVRLNQLGTPRRIGEAWAWLVATARNENDMSDGLKDLCHNNGTVFISEVKHGYNGWWSDVDWKWIDGRAR